MIVYVDNPMEIYKKAPRTNAWVSKVAAYKVNTQKSIIFLYPSNQSLETEIEKKKKKKQPISVMIALKRMKYLGLNLTKHVQDLHAEDYKTPEKEIKDHWNKWADILCSWIGRFNIVIKISLLGLPSWCNGWESAYQCRGHGFDPGPEKSHMPWSN